MKFVVMDTDKSVWSCICENLVICLSYQNPSLPQLRCFITVDKSQGLQRVEYLLIFLNSIWLIQDFSLLVQLYPILGAFRLVLDYLLYSF